MPSCSDSKEIQNISIERVGRSFGFTIRGGEEYNCPISILKIAEGGAAHIDERLKVCAIHLLLHIVK